MMPESFVSVIWKKYFHYYIIPEWKNWIYTLSFFFFFGKNISFIKQIFNFKNF